MKKLIIILVAISVALYCIPFAYAEVNANDSSAYVDLLSSQSGYTITVYGLNSDKFPSFTFLSDVPYFESVLSSEYGLINYADCEKVEITWQPVNLVSSKDIFCYCYRNNAGVNFYLNGSQIPDSSTGDDQGWYLYRAISGYTLYNEIKVTFQKGGSLGSFNKAPAIVSCFTYCSQTGTFIDGDISADRYLSDYNDDLGAWTHSIDRYLDSPLRLQTDKDYSYYNPAIKYENYWINDFKRLDQMRIHLIFDLGSEAPFPNLDLVRLSFASIGSTELTTAFLSSSYSEFSNDGLVLNDSYWYGDFASDGLTNPWTAYEANGYNLFIDISDLNFKDNPYLHIELVVNPLQTTGEPGDSYTYFELFEAEYTYSFYSDLSESIILSDLYQILNNTNSISNVLFDYYHSYSAFSDAVIQYFDQIIESLNSTSEQQQEIDEGKQQMQNQAGALSDLNNVMGAVEKPNVDFSDAVADVGGTILPNNYLSYIVNEPHVYVILATVCLLMVISFIFFGKKR